MLRLSSIFKPQLRPWIALASVGLVVTVLVVASLDVHRRGQVPWVLVAVSVPMVGAACANVRNALLTGMVDKAWIEGDELLLRRAGQPIRISLVNIAAVDVGPGGLTTLELSMPCTLGWRIRFIASRVSRGNTELELRRRIDEARQRRA